MATWLPTLNEVVEILLFHLSQFLPSKVAWIPDPSDQGSRVQSTSDPCTCVSLLHLCLGSSSILILLSLQKKKRTHVEQDESALPQVPRTFVMERGRIGSTLNQLVLDLRQVMEPHTASKLKVWRELWWTS